MDKVVVALKTKRDELNSQVKQLLTEIKSERDRLRSIDAKIIGLRDKRDAKNRLVAELNKKKKSTLEKIKKYQCILKENDGESAKYEVIPKDTSKLKNDIKKLEWDIQTRQHTIKKDEQLRKRLDYMEQVLTLSKSHKTINKKISSSNVKISKEKEDLDLTEQLIIDNNEAGKIYHRELVGFYDKIRGLRTKLAPKFKEIEALRAQADTAHKEFIEEQNKQHERKIAKIKTDKINQEKEKNQQERELRDVAKKLYADFTQGKKLTAEELMIIQKYGES